MIDQNNLNPFSHYAIQDAPPAADTRHIKIKFLNIPYAQQSPLQKLDIYLPDDFAQAIKNTCFDEIPVRAVQSVKFDPMQLHPRTPCEHRSIAQVL